MSANGFLFFTLLDFFFLKKEIYSFTLFPVHKYFTYTYVQAPCVHLVPEEARSVLELELQMAVNHRVWGWEQNQGPSRSNESP